jgi:uncharacterized membrane protein
MARNAIGGVIAVALALGTAGSAHAQNVGMEKCYGVARAGANDGMGDADAPGGASVDFQGDAWKLVPEGTCLTMPLPPQTDGTPRRGSLHPLKRDLR